MQDQNVEYFFNELKKIHLNEMSLLKIVKNDEAFQGGLYHKITNADFIKSKNISAIEQIYLIHRLFFIYSNIQKIEKQVCSLNIRKASMLHCFFEISEIQNKIKSDIIFQQIQSLLPELKFTI